MGPMAIYETTVQPIATRDSAVRAIPGALAFFGAIGFGVGIIDSGMREQLAPLLVGCAVVAVVFGAWHYVLWKAGNRPLAVHREGDELRVQLAGQVLRAPAVERGVFLMRGVKRSYWVAWVRLDDGAHTAVVRKGLGIADAKPSWPEGTYPPASLGEFYGDAVRLAGTLG